MILKDNPFYILKCMPESSRSAIHEQAEERSFDLNENICKEAEAILINTKKRLEAEICWFPGFDLNTLSDRLKLVFSEPRKYVSDLLFMKTKKYLAEANFLAFGLESVNDVSIWSKDDIRMATSFLCTFAEKINIEETILLIKQSREISKFPVNILTEDAAYFIEEQKAYYEKILYNFFQKIESELSVEILTKMVNESTSSGEKTSKWFLLDKLITKYENDLSDFFIDEEALIIKDTELIRDVLASNNSNNLDYFYDQLEKDLNHWKSIVYPIMM